jgi:phospholipid N-methyltransferase
MAEAARPVDDAARRGDRPQVVVELGPGSGSVTAALAARTGPRDRHLAVEINPVLAHRLAGRFPRVEVVPADVAELPTLLALRGLPAVDVVVSGLGWSATRPGADDALVPALSRVLADDGVLVQFAYRWTRWASPARALRAELDSTFCDVDDSSVIWRNLPPAVVYRASRPRR